MTCAVRSRHVTFLDSTDLKIVLSRIISYICSFKALSYSTPWWQCLSWRELGSNRTAGWLLSNKMGCFTSKFVFFPAVLFGRLHKLGRWDQWMGRRGKGFNFGDLLTGESFNKPFFSALNDSSCITKSFCSASASSFGLMIDASIVQWPVSFGIARKMCATMRKSFSCELYFHHSKVDALVVALAMNVEASCNSELNLVSVASLVHLIFLAIS